MRGVHRVPLACHERALRQRFGRRYGPRAHYCKCLVVPLALVDASICKALFVNGGSRASVDRREQWVQAVLAQAPAVPNPTQGAWTGTGTTGSNTSDPAIEPPRGASIDTAVDGWLGRVRIRRGPHGKRVLYATIEARETVTATLSITRQRTSLARRTVAAGRGSRTLTPHSAGYRLRVCASSAEARRQRRNLHAPHKRSAHPATYERPRRPPLRSLQ